MKQFFASFLGSLTGIIVTFILAAVILGAVIAGAIGSATKKQPKIVKSNSVLHLKLNKEIPERGTNDPFSNFDFVSMSHNRELGLNQILKLIDNAKEDDKIKGIFLDLSYLNCGMATMEEIRNALVDFKTSKKFILCYGEVFSQGAFYLASTADEVYLNPMGLMDFRGFSTQLMFFKGMLEKLEIQPQVFRHGKFKSAVEPFILDKMSDSNREQIRRYVGSLWGHYLDGIEASTDITKEALNDIASRVAIENADSAKKFGFVDDLLYKDEFFDLLRKKLEIEEDKKINLISLREYNKRRKHQLGKKITSKDKIAVIYAVGGIQSGDNETDAIGSESLTKTIRKARKDSSIKAIVLRVNSPGGSALASDVIWREVKLAKESKPVIVSMGDVAASGGYYIACAADAIVAQPNTITGSIGVFGLLPNMKGLFNNKLGITIDTVNTNVHADFGTPFRQVDEFERKLIQRSIEEIYSTFIERVAEGRGMSVEGVDSIGQGRVWSGIDALELGLIDKLGGLEDAIELAAQEAGIKEYRIRELPKEEDPFEKFIKEFGGELSTKIVKAQLGEQYESFMNLKKLTNSTGIMAQMPYELKIY